MTLKKIILIGLLLLIKSNICFAEEKYEIRYKWYKEEIVGDYFIEGTPNKYQYCDNNKYIYSDYIDDFKLLDNTVDLSDKNKDYELKTIYYYKKPVKIKFINLGYFSDSLDIKKINIYYKDTLLNYNTINTYGTDWDGIMGNFNTYSFLSLSLDKMYDPQDINVEIITSPTNGTVNYQIRYAIGFNDVSDANVMKYLASSNETKYKPSNSWDILKFENKIYEASREEFNDNIGAIESMKVYYRYRNRLIYYYNINREYYDDNYHASIDGYIPDYNDYKVYTKGDKLEDDKVKMIDNTITNTSNIRETFSTDTSNIRNTNTVNNLSINSDVNKYLVVASAIISLTIIGVGLISISCKKCRVN